MRRVALTAAALVGYAAVAAGGAGDAPVSWTHEGYRSLVQAAATAKQNERLLLVGLSGGDT